MAEGREEERFFAAPLSRRFVLSEGSPGWKIPEFPTFQPDSGFCKPDICHYRTFFRQFTISPITIAPTSQGGCMKRPSNRSERNPRQLLPVLYLIGVLVIFIVVNLFIPELTSVLVVAAIAVQIILFVVFSVRRQRSANGGKPVARTDMVCHVLSGLLGFIVVCALTSLLVIQFTGRILTPIADRAPPSSAVSFSPPSLGTASAMPCDGFRKKYRG
jgi:hypothetical protein